MPSEIPVSPAVALPTYEIFTESTSSPSRGTEQLSQHLQRVSEHAKFSGTLTLLVDRWDVDESAVHGSDAGKSSQQAYIEFLAAFARTCQIRIHGPSTGELRKMLPTAGSDTLELPTYLVDFLRSPACTGIEGGSDLKLYLAAHEAGIAIAYGHNMQRTRLLVESDDAAHNGEQFLLELSQFRSAIISGGKKCAAPVTWFPWSAIVLDRSMPKSVAPLGLELLKSIVLARLLIPELTSVRAPVALFGPKLAHLALHSGADNLGYAAIDFATAEHTGLTRYHEVVQEFFADDVEVA